MKKVVEIESLHFSYPDGTAALKGISLTVEEGERVALMGPNGAGKSTFLLHLNGIFSGDGAIRIDGLPVEKQNLKAIRQKVGLVFQNAAFLLEDATVIFDGSGSRRFRRELKTYVRKTVTQKTGRQGLIKEVQMQDSKRSNLVQLADMICGAITHSYKKRARDPRCYRSMISGRERQVQFWPTKDSPNPSL